MGPELESVVNALILTAYDGWQSEYTEVETGSAKEEVEGIWLKPHLAGKKPLFVDEEGNVFQARHIGRFVSDDNGSRKLYQMMQVYPPHKVEPSVKPLATTEALQALIVYLTDRVIRDRANGESGPTQELNLAIILLQACAF